jgi:anti-sigma B factor antagonist
MTRTESLPISLTRRDPAAVVGDERFTVVWVGGEHDVSTKVALAAVLARAAELDTGDVLVDLSGVTFMDASIVGTLVGARNRLASLARSLDIRAPSRAAQHVLEVCGVTHLVREAADPELHRHGAAASLATWVDVPRPVVEQSAVVADTRAASAPASGV